MMSDLPLVRENRIGAYGVLVKNGAMLLIRKARGPYTGLYDLPGGGLEWGEAPEAAVVRELLEEAGVAVGVERLLGSFSRVATWVHPSGERRIELHHMGFLYGLTGQVGPLKEEPDGEDSLGAEWVPLAGLTDETASPLVMRALELL